jgi:DNA-binding transcriptional LysR family regulator
LGSVTDAAAELDLTQGAVSRQILKLEALLDLSLFQRDRKRLILTTAGTAYAHEIREAITRIANATVTLRSNPDGGAFDLAILPAFGTHWLAPRLPLFLSAHPGITLNLATRMAPFDFSQERFHAAIHFGSDNWPGAGFLRLMEEEVVPVMAPVLAQTIPLEPAEIATLPLLHLETRPKSWARWFAQNNIISPSSAGMEFDQFATMLKAATFGLGVALMPRYLVQQELRDGSLVTLPNAEMVNSGSYFLVWPETQSDYPPLRAFRNWLTTQITPQ